MENAFKNTFIVKIIWSKTPAQEWRYSVRLLTFSKLKNTGLVKTNRSAHGNFGFFSYDFRFFFLRRSQKAVSQTFSKTATKKKAKKKTKDQKAKTQEKASTTQAEKTNPTVEEDDK